MGKKYFYLFLLCNAIYAKDIVWFPNEIPFFSASSLDLRNYLYVGSENGRTVNHGNIGVEFPVIRVVGTNEKSYGAGIAAATHLVMYPKNLKFAVDNFYATLAVYAEAKPSSDLMFRLYPVYHVSGHLADGSHNDSALAHARAVSGEMARIEGEYAPQKWMTFSAGYGYYYHVCAQQGLTDRFDLALRLRPLLNKYLRPYLTLSCQFISLIKWRAGADIEAGSEFINSHGRGIGVGFRYFNQMDPGYYFDRREKTLGLQMDFLL